MRYRLHPEPQWSRRRSPRSFSAKGARLCRAAQARTKEHSAINVWSMLESLLMENLELFLLVSACNE